MVTVLKAAHGKRLVSIEHEQELTNAQLDEIALEVSGKTVFWRDVEPYGYWFFDFPMRGAWIESAYEPGDPFEPVMCRVTGDYDKQDW